MSDRPADDAATDLRYPVGRFETPDLPATAAQRRRWIDEISIAPRRLEEAVDGLDDARLDTPYRPGGWTVRQLVHHVADSHVMGYARVKRALTEDEPVVEAYAQDAWSALTDARGLPVTTSLSLLTALHARWTTVLEALEPDDFLRTLRHPEWGVVTLDEVIGVYAWHGAHHAAHVTALREREGW